MQLKGGDEIMFGGSTRKYVVVMNSSINSSSKLDKQKGKLFQGRCWTSTPMPRTQDCWNSTGRVPLLVEVENYCIHSDYGYEIIQLPQGQEMNILYTKGYWKDTKSIRVDLGDHGGRLKLSRSDPCWGLSIKEFRLKPLQVRAES